MRNKMLLAVAAFGLLSPGCAMMHQMAMDAHVQDNLPFTTKLSDHDVLVAGEKVAHTRGFSDCEELTDHKGADFNGTICRCTRHNPRDLGSAITANVVGNMLGADRGQITKDHVVSVDVVIRHQWTPDGEKDSGVIGWEVSGREYDVTQNDEEANSVDFDSERIDGWNKDMNTAMAKH
ncbi:MAG TPA: hypothetical protein VK842_06385 [bacterium]|jgi:hypothetical protein|nr:hypothetical protein [bacterium]